jgi:phosphoglycolate phosphatase
VTFRLVVFDLDGTLIDSIGDLALAVNRLVGELGGRALRLDEVSAMVGEGAGLLVRRALRAGGVDGADPALALRRFLEIYDSILPGRTRPYEGIPEALTALAPHATLAVLTNKPTAATVKLLETLDLSRFFPLVVGGDGPFRRKPDPDGLCHLLAAAAASPADAVLVGDSMVDLQTARAAGVAACVARYGFGQMVFSASALRGDELLADSPADLPRLLLPAR